MVQSIVVAQTQSPNTWSSTDPIPPLLLQPPASGLADTLILQPGQLVDFRSILDAEISFFRVGGDLELAFAEGGSLIVQGFFSGSGSELIAIVGEDQILSLDAFSSISALQDASEFQTAAGETTTLSTELGGDQGSSEGFRDADIGDLGDGLNTLDLLQPGPPLDHEVPEEDAFSDGDDGDPELLTTAENSRVDEADLADGNGAGDGPLTVSGNLNVSFGEDGGSSPSLTFRTDASGIPVDDSGVPLALTSDNVGLAYTITDNSDGGQTLVAANPATSEVVFTVTLEILPDAIAPGVAGASYTFTLSGNLDHFDPAVSEELPLTFGFSAADTAGDFVTSEFTVTVVDDAVVIGASETTSVDEEGLATGTTDSGYDGDLTGSALTSSGDLAISWGADDANPSDGGGSGDRSVAFASSQPGLSGLTSNGADVSVAVLSDGTLVGYTGTSVPTTTGDAGVVFHAALSDSGSGSYSFTLVQNLDHPEAASEDDLELVFAFTATDGDGDAASSTFTVVVDDDAVVIGASETTSVDEEGLATGTTDSGYDGDLTGSALTSSGDLAISWGADDANPSDGGGSGDRSVAFASSQPGLSGLTSNGADVSVAVLSDGTLVGYTGTSVPTTTGDAGVVFHAALSDSGSGSYSFTLVQNLDHPEAASEDDLELVFAFTATDGDGDAAFSTFTVVVDDDAVVIGASETTSVDEEGLATGTTDSGYDGDLTGSALTSSGDLAISWGADDANPSDGGGSGDRSVAFASSQPGLSGLTSNGADVSVAVLSDGTLVGYTGTSVPTTTGDAGVVFHAALSDSGSGSYSFTLVQNLDHPEAASEDDLELVFAFTATDGDGDAASSTFTVVVDDDAVVIGASETTSVDEEGLATGTTDSGL